MAHRPPPEPSKEDKLETLHARLVDAVAELATSEGWARMLAAAAKFHDYSGGGVGVFEAQELRLGSGRNALSSPAPAIR